MLSVVKRELNVSVITSLIYVVIGVIIVMYPEKVLDVISTGISILAIVSGIIVTVINIANLKEEGTLLLGIFLLVIGIALLIYPNSLNVLLSLLIGIWFISSSVTRIKFAILIKDVKEVNWSFIMVNSIVTLIIGISFVFAPLSSAVFITTISGILMVIYAVLDIIEVLFIKKNMKILEKVF